MKKIKLIITIFYILINPTYIHANDNFEEWKKNFFNHAISQGVSEKTLSLVINNLEFLPKVIEYDRYQPEFYEDTFTYISKRANLKRIKIGVLTFNKNSALIVEVEKKFEVGKNFEGEVSSINDQGISISIDSEFDGFIQVSELSWLKKPPHPNKIVQLNDKLSVKLIEINSEKRKMFFSLRQLKPNPWSQISNKFKVGDIIET